MASTGSDKTEYDLSSAFRAQRVLPDAVKAFSLRSRPLAEAIGDADIVLDTNALLIPYGAGAASLNQIIDILSRLANENRIYLPAQAAREFVKNRPNKIGELIKGIPDKLSTLVVPSTLSYPILEGVDEYGELNALLNEAKDLKKKILNAQRALGEQIQSWEWDDPVSSSYKKVFNADNIIELLEGEDALLKEHLIRQKLQIPPGYKDQTKDDYGIGDFLIWKTILQIGIHNKKDLIFVSGDEKADWQHRSDGSGFAPRYELVNEYAEVAQDRSFYIIQLSKLLELLEAKQDLVEEVQQEEARVQAATQIAIGCPYCDAIVASSLNLTPGSSAMPTCTTCHNHFHLHRNGEGGVLVRRRFENRGDDTVVECPSCTTAIEAVLKQDFNATTWCFCHECSSTFAIHRQRNGAVKVGPATTRVG
ncbi:PIN domain-containing protein [Pseudomonas graminis]|uniref:PIN domain-containing protein n=1 Tax=Pseudomonas graminis TaxID=158627 RepID=UPI002349F260|nr:PIN domain-containing protein [Pseudomonas graminis]MDC6379923.1 PIN domain-containing protein [Pseudomonas graminis]